jgi:hemolysin III
MALFLQKFRNPISGLTHFTGFLLSLLGLLLMESFSITHGTLRHIFSAAIFGISLILLYGASSLYHLLPLSPRGISTLRRIDHVMIFVLIAGSYTPVCLIPLHGIVGWWLCAIIWGMALAGVFQALFWIHAPRWFSTSLYLVMGWMVIIVFYPLTQAISYYGIVWFIVGGLSYTIGAVCYAAKWPDPIPGIFGFHEIWHLFVMAGSFCHFWAILNYVLTLP